MLNSLLELIAYMTVATLIQVYASDRDAFIHLKHVCQICILKGGEERWTRIKQ